MKKMVILIGNYGSGKTEIALNMAVMAASEGKRTQVIDLDRINDYFRMSDHVKLLEEKKVDIVSPTFAGQGVTQSSVSAAVASAFAQDWDLVIFDVGGARQEVTGFINNSNLLNYASAEDLRRGYEVLQETSLMSGIPVVHTTGRREYLEEFLADGRDAAFIGVPIALDTYMHRSWDSFAYGGI